MESDLTFILNHIFVNCLLCLYFHKGSQKRFGGNTKLNFPPLLSSAAFLSQTWNRRHFFFLFYTNSSSLKCHQSSDETGGDIFMQVVASASLISISLPPTLKLQPIAGIICSYVKPTIWQSRRSKPKQGCTDSWRLSCKIKQKNKLLSSPPLEVVSSPSASTVSYLESVYFKNKDSSEMGSMRSKQLKRLKIRIPLDSRTWSHRDDRRGPLGLFLGNVYGLKGPIIWRVDQAPFK